MLSALGVNVRLLSTIVFGFGAALAPFPDYYAALHRSWTPRQRRVAALLRAGRELAQVAALHPVRYQYAADRADRGAGRELRLALDRDRLERHGDRRTRDAPSGGDAAGRFRQL